MKCPKHGDEAVGICSWCGRALCAACASSTSAGARLTCSDACAKGLARQDGALDLLLRKSRQSARATSVYYYVCGVLSAAAAVASSYWLPIPFLIWFLGASSLALMISGYWFGRAAGKTD